MSSSYNLFLDDLRICSNMINPIYLTGNWVTCKNYESFINCIKLHGLPLIISFDHDLHPEHYGIDFRKWEFCSSEQLGVPETGYDCALYLVDYCQKNQLPLPFFVVHSSNPVGKERIVKYLKRQNL